VVDNALSRGLAPASLCRQVRSVLVRIVQMLTRLNASMTTPHP